ncbi:MAG: leucyl/phenylalanyl-tRNA--protein transferase [Treponema sp.]|jgi:leucyl/phenylalanyl-tRNA--protein transferase|nr:leucyl/phenylalanyl-tRNA--protein transferase [Treponema sp.]
MKGMRYYPPKIYSDIPYLSENERFVFPPAEKSGGAIVAIGGNLSPGMLLSAYEQGIFPWYSEGEPILWQSPDPRFVIFPEKLHISTSMRKVFKKKQFEVHFDRDFAGVIKNCAYIPRPWQAGTWLTDEMIDAYITLHKLGFAHSAESYIAGELVGGCYGVKLGRVFSGESMFTKVSNASKAAFLTLARFLFDQGVLFIDSQVYTPYIESLGGQNMKRSDYLILLRTTLSLSKSYRDENRCAWAY